MPSRRLVVRNELYEYGVRACSKYAFVSSSDMSGSQPHSKIYLSRATY